MVFTKQNTLHILNRVVVLLPLLVISLNCLAQESNKLSYHLRFNEDSARTVFINAVFESEKEFTSLQMDPYGIPDHIDRKWAKFVTIESAYSGNNLGVNLTWNDASQTWDLDSKTRKINVRYKVILNHDKYDWSLAGGQDARPALLEKDVSIWITKALFIFPEIDNDSHVDIYFELPKNWRVSTPWGESEKNNLYSTSLRSARSNVIMIGNHTAFDANYDSMKLKIAIAPKLEPYRTMLSETMKEILPVYKKVFGELPNLHYLICASTNFFEDGEAFRNSFHQMFTKNGLEYKKIVWVNVFAHELFHLWNGTNFLVGKNFEDSYWFSEGFTEYYSNLVMVRTGIISQEDFLKKLSFQFSRYFTARFLSSRPQVSLIQAGKEKFKNWGLIYGGGSTLAFTIDVKIRHTTNGEKSLDDFMKLLYQRFGKNHIKYTIDDLSALLTEMTGENYTDFFNQYVYESEFLPLQRINRLAGLNGAQYMGEFYLEQASKGSESIITDIMSDN